MTHATYHAHDAEIRVFPAEEPYDRSDMYVMEVLDTTVTVYLKQADPADETSGSRLQIVIETPAPFTVDINGDSNDYGDGLDDDPQGKDGIDDRYVKRLMGIPQYGEEQ